jgi:hypothetical protein
MLTDRDFHETQTAPLHFCGPQLRLLFFHADREKNSAR